MKKYQIMVINNYFSTGNMLIIKNEDNQIITNFGNEITPEDLDEELFRHNIVESDCDIVVIERGGWSGKIKAEEF